MIIYKSTWRLTLTFRRKRKKKRQRSTEGPTGHAELPGCLRPLVSRVNKVFVITASFGNTGPTRLRIRKQAKKTRGDGGKQSDPRPRETTY
ncbi:MAG: hypothetical protein BJ554DRAFT_1703 [Olpidium bornovanus]|uniref:Uncharacterized protein n=1 Tax=Olpidium bornovanus TaxID=278681 RepID=A0A8H8DHI1_9FUNG|nr:MAG: hypothetical protein BJ554DRAFT_1703 [Olpidium bornovanus]KAG5458137.1 MAG: hypothetical protein BJ554DRAFT_1703 [Olpidium bornovanus]